MFFIGTLTPLTVDIEEAELEMYKRHKRYFEEAKVMGTSTWKYMHDFKGDIDVQRDIFLFEARYSSSLKLRFICDECSEEIKNHWYRCLHCICMDLCTNCYKNEKSPSGHLDSHEFIYLRLVEATSNLSTILLFCLPDYQNIPIVLKQK